MADRLAFRPPRFDEVSAEIMRIADSAEWTDADALYLVGWIVWTLTATDDDHDDRPTIARFLHDLADAVSPPRRCVAPIVLSKN